MIMAGNSNPVWNYFRRNESTATCIVCMKQLSLGSTLPKNQTVSSIKKHLEKVHPHEYAAFRKLEEEYVLQKNQNVNLKRRAKRKRLKEIKEALEGPKERKKPGRKRKVDKYSESEDLDQSSSTNIEIVVHDPLIMNTHETAMEIASATHISDEMSLTLHEQKKPIFRPGDIALSRRIDRSILDLIVVDLLPFSIVEGEAFKRLNLTDPARPSKYVPKSSDFYRNNLMPETYEAVKKKVMANLEQAEWISLTTTRWSHYAKSCSLHAVTGHFLHENQKHMVVLQIAPSDTPAATSLDLVDLTRKFNIVDKVHLNVVQASDSQRQSEWFNALECSAELLENVISESLLSHESIEILKRKCHSIIDHFESNPSALVNLSECQESCGLPHQKLVMDMADNWTSTFLMWQQLNDNKSALELYIQQYSDLQLPSSYEWQQVNHLVLLLRVFYQAWLDINSNAACVSVIIPLLTMINAKLEAKMTDPQDLTYLKQSVKTLLNESFAFVHQSSFLIIATLLDPRFKMRYLTESQVSSCHAEMTHNLRISLNLQEDGMNPSFNTLPANNFKFHNTSDLWEEHDTSTLTQSNSNESVFLAFEQQLSFYLKEPLIARNGNIYQYWNITPYEYLRKLAYKYMTAPPTTLACNEIISNVGFLYAERRLATRNEDGEDEKLLFMACNIRLFNFDY